MLFNYHDKVLIFIKLSDELYEILINVNMSTLNCINLKFVIDLI